MHLSAGLPAGDGGGAQVEARLRVPQHAAGAVPAVAAAEAHGAPRLGVAAADLADLRAAVQLHRRPRRWYRYIGI